MKRKFIILTVILHMFPFLALTGCESEYETDSDFNNRDNQGSILNTVSYFDTAIVNIGDRTYLFNIEKWYRFDKHGQIELQLYDGNVLLVPISGTTLINSNSDSVLMERLTQQSDTVVYKN